MKCLCACVGGLKIMKDAFGKKNTPILQVSSAHPIPISWCNIKLKCIIHKGYSYPSFHFFFSIGNVVAHSHFCCMLSYTILNIHRHPY